MNPDSNLAQKLSVPGKARACYCLRMAFKVAEESGDRDTAMEWWNEAIKAGYFPKHHTKTLLLKKIKEVEHKNR